MIIRLIGPDGVDNLDPIEGWGEVPEADRPEWARYMLDHCPTFPGASMMPTIASGIVNGGTCAPQVWKDTAAELHSAGFTPIQYYLLCNLLARTHRRDELDEATHGHLFKTWFAGPVSSFRLEADAWKPWLERLKQAQSPSRALAHMLHGPDLPPLGAVVLLGEPSRIVTD